MRASSKHFPELGLSYADVHSCRGQQRMAQPFRQVAAEVGLYFRVCLNSWQR
jgi:orotidine-5'-phosphate decarboxylase